MRRLGAYWLHAVLGVCALATLALVLAPLPEAATAAAPRSARYVGADFEIRTAARLSNFVLSLSAPAAATPTESVPVPTLVGLAGRSAYFKSAASGEMERISIGEELDGWRLVGIGARAVTLRGSTGDRRLDLFAMPDPTPEDRQTEARPAEASGG